MGSFSEQSSTGLPEFKIANLFEDMPMLKLVQNLAIKIEQEDAKLNLNKNERLKKLVDRKFMNRIEI